MKWVKGQSGNPAGRPQSPEKRLFIAECRSRWEKVLKILDKSLESTNKDDQKWAAELLLDRAFGKPETSGSLEIESNESTPTPEQLANRYEQFKAILAARAGGILKSTETNGVEP